MRQNYQPVVIWFPLLHRHVYYGTLHPQNPICVKMASPCPKMVASNGSASTARASVRQE